MAWRQLGARVTNWVDQGLFRPKILRKVKAVNLEGEFFDYPSSDLEWLEYSLSLLDSIQEVLDTGIIPPWSTLRFRNEENFRCGTYNDHVQAWLPILNAIPSEKTKELAYRILHSGVDLFGNLAIIDRKDPRAFRGKKCIYTKFVTHPFNRSLSVKGLDWHGRKGKFGKKVHTRVLAPMRKQGGEFRDSFFRMKNSAKVLDHENTIKNHILDHIGNGSLEYLGPEGSNIVKNCAMLTSGLVIVPKGADSFRVCYDGGPIKAVERFTIPCKLDSIAKVLLYIKKDDYMVKYDDKSGFFQLKLAEFSRNLACFEWGGHFFRFIGAVFGLPRIPGDFQLINSIGVSYLRTLGVLAFLYLDDRLIIERGLSEQDIQDISKGKKASRGAYLCTAIMLTLGGFVNRAKSTFIPSKEIQFLGFVLNTAKQTIRIPEDKWEKFCAEALKIINSRQVPYKDLEKIRGRMCSFMIVCQNMRLYIRRITEVLCEADLKGARTINVDNRIVKELKTWLNLKYITTERKWLKKGQSGVKISVFTDASLFAAGIVIEDFGINRNFQWDNWVKFQPIHIKEAYTIKLVLIHYASLLKDSRINFLCDNMAVVKTFEFGASNPVLNNIIREINELAVDNNMVVTIDWVSTLDQAADEKSREIDQKEEILKAEVFEKLEVACDFQFSLDGAARPFNTKLPKFISLGREDQAWAFDFLGVKDFKEENIYVFPPFPMVDLFFLHLKAVAMSNNWCLVFHVFEDWPIFMAEIHKDSRFKILELGNRENPASLFPSKTCSKSFGYYEHNTLALLTVALIFTP